MATRLKPSRINVDNTPRVGNGAAYQNDNDFHWSEGGGDMSYEDFEWVTLTGNSLVIEKISNNVTPTGNFTVTAGTLRPGIEYVLRVNTGNTPYTMTLGTGVTNPNSYKTELKPNTVNQFKFIATSTNQLELEGVDSAVVSEINWGEIDGTLSDQTDLQNALDQKLDKVTSTATNPRAYVVNADGSQAILPITDSATSGAIVRRNGTQITVPATPSANTDAASKKYVDDQVSAATAGAVSDAAYDATTWDGVTGIAPSKNAVRDKIVTMDSAISGNTSNISTINGKIPSEASTSNQLADKAYVGDSINSVTAYYITKNANGDQFATYAELAAATTFYSGGVVRVPTKNDYTIVLDDENHDHATTRYIYNNGWEYQYTVNETALTQAQLNALNSGITAAKVTKYDTLNTREFTLSDVGSSATVLAEAQEVFDWIRAGNFAILKITTDSGQPTYLYKATTVDDVRFLSSDMVDGGYSDNFTTAMQKGVEIHYSGTTVTGVSYINNLTWQFLAINGQYQSAFMPTQDAHPATKKYVDSKSTIVSATAPSSPTEGMVWYDTTNDVLKAYDGTNWNVTGKEYNAGEGIEIGTYNDYSVMRGPCSEGYHIPTYEEMSELVDYFGSISGATSANFSTWLKVPIGGYRGNIEAQAANTIYNAGDYGFYWTSKAATQPNAYQLRIVLGSVTMLGTYRSSSGMIRPFKDEAVVPDNSWTTEYQGTGSAGIYSNATLGLISISSDGTNWITIANKNLGATTVYNYGDTFSQANCGNFYQWGNNYGFPYSGTITSDSTQVDTTGYGPGNYYSSSTFITRNTNVPRDWSSIDNKNLWGGETGTVDNAIINTGVLSVNGQTGAVTVSEFKSNNGGVKIFDMPTVNSSMDSIIQWFTGGGDILLREITSNVEYYYFVNNWDGSGRTISVKNITGTTVTVKGIAYDASGICTNIVVNNQYLVPSGGNNGDVLTNVSGTPTWQAPSGGDVMVSSQTGNILTSGTKLRAGTEADYGNLGTYDNNTIYLTI